jgi:hypothetical protein
MVLSGKEGILGDFCFLRPNVYHATIIYAFQIMHFLFVSSINAI